MTPDTQQKKHVYMHRKNKTTHYLEYPPHLLIKEKNQNPNRQDLPEPTDLIYLGFHRQRGNTSISR
jgi:hypothetical protein